MQYESYVIVTNLNHGDGIGGRRGEGGRVGGWEVGPSGSVSGGLVEQNA